MDGFNRRNGNKCLYFVSVLNVFELKLILYIVLILCGLILDFLVMVVGILGIKIGMFFFELIGLKLFGEGDEFVVFYFFVCLYGDELINKFFIV